MLHTCFIVYDNKMVCGSQLIEKLSQEIIDGAVAVRAFGPAHSKQIEAVGLGNRLLDVILEGADFIHTGGGLLLPRLLAELCDGDGGRDTQHQAEAGIRVGIDGKDAAASASGKEPDEHSGQCSFA
jgi:hypothetical protein